MLQLMYISYNLCQNCHILSDEYRVGNFIMSRLWTVYCEFYIAFYKKKIIILFYRFVDYLSHIILVEENLHNYYTSNLASLLKCASSSRHPNSWSDVGRTESHRDAASDVAFPHSNWTWRWSRTTRVAHTSETCWNNCFEELLFYIFR